MQKMVTDLAKPMIAYPGGKGLLKGYAILLEILRLED
jgi:hypothetical protein